MNSVHSMVGLWQIEAARGKNLNGDWQDEKVYGGSACLTKSGKICTFVKTSEYMMGFSGTYTFDGKILKQTVEVSTNPEFEKRTHVREVTFIEPNLINFAAVDDSTGLPYLLVFRRVESLG